MISNDEQTTSEKRVAESVAAMSSTGRLAKKAYITVVLGMGGFLIWAALAPLDQGVPTSGIVSVDTKRKSIQHLQGGIIDKVYVQEGQNVAKGDQLLRLNDSALRADFELVRQQFFSLKAIEGRLMAEQRGMEAIKFAPELVAEAQRDLRLTQQMTNETRLLQSKRASLRAQLDTFEESRKSYQAQSQSSVRIKENLQSQKLLLDKEIIGVRNLVREGFAPLSQQLSLERAISTIENQISEIEARAMQAEQAILELRQNRIKTLADYQRDVEQQLSQLRPELRALKERLRAVSENLKRSTLVSPVDGQVVGLQFQTVGGVIGPGQKIMDVVPKDELLLVETRIEAPLIDRVKEGDAVDLRFAGFANSPQLVIEGVLKSLSADVITDGSTSTPPYYLARIEVTPAGLKTLGARKLQPGMPVVAVVKTGRRTFLEYILHPLTIRMASSLKEQ